MIHLTLFYIFVKLYKGATTFVKRAKQVAVFLWPWEFCPKKEVGGSIFLPDMYYYKQKNSQKITKKYVKNMDISCCCHIVEEAVFRVQGPYPIQKAVWKMETNRQRSSKKNTKQIKKDIGMMFPVPEGALFRVHI